MTHGLAQLATLQAAPDELARHAAVLMIAAPLVGACLAMLAWGPRAAHAVGLASAGFSVWMGLALAGEVARQGAVVYEVGGYAPLLGVELRADGASVLFALLIAAAGLLAIGMSGPELRGEIEGRQRVPALAGMLVCLSGLLALTVVGDMFTAFVFLEVASIGTYALVAAGREDRRSLPAAFNYLMWGALGATFYLMGVAFLFGVTGTLNMAEMARRLAALPVGGGAARAAAAGAALAVIGLAIKAALFPLHRWLPDAYAHAPSPVATLLAAASTKAAMLLLARILFGVLAHRTALQHVFLALLLAPMGAVGVLIATGQALWQGGLRRLLALSTVAQTGYAALGVSLGTAAGLTAAYMQLVADGLAKAVMFIALGGIAARMPVSGVKDFVGAGKVAPLTMTAFAIGALSVAGLPLTIGFGAKWLLFGAAFSASSMWIIAVMAIGALGTLIYTARLLEQMFFMTRPADAPELREAPPIILASAWIAAWLCLFFGATGSLPIGLADLGARNLMQPSVAAPAAAPIAPIAPASAAAPSLPSEPPAQNLGPPR